MIWTNYSPQWLWPSQCMCVCVSAAYSYSVSIVIEWCRWKQTRKELRDQRKLCFHRVWRQATIDGKSSITSLCDRLLVGDHRRRLIFTREYTNIEKYFHLSKRVHRYICMQSRRFDRMSFSHSFKCIIGRISLRDHNRDRFCLFLSCLVSYLMIVVVVVV